MIMTVHCLANRLMIPCNFKYNYMKGDYSTLNTEFNGVDWDTLLCHESIDINWNLFKNTVPTISFKYIPKTTKKPTSNKPSWWYTQISKTIKEKQQLYSHYKFTHSDDDYAAYVVKKEPGQVYDNIC